MEIICDNIVKSRGATQVDVDDTHSNFISILHADNGPPQDVAASLATVVPQAAESQLGDGRGLLRDRARSESLALNTGLRFGL